MISMTFINSATYRIKRHSETETERFKRHSKTLISCFTHDDSKAHTNAGGPESERVAMHLCFLTITQKKIPVTERRKALATLTTNTCLPHYSKALLCYSGRNAEAEDISDALGMDA